MDQYENTQEQEIDLKELWYIFSKNSKLIAIIVLISMIIAATVSFFVLDKQYESYSTIMLGRSNNSQESSPENVQGYTNEDVLLNKQLVGTYGEIIKSRNVTEKVIKNLNLDITPAQLGSMIAISTVNETEIIKISVTNTDPILPAKIANETAIVFMKYVSELMQIDNVDIVDIAEASDKPIAPNPKLNIAISFVLGLMLGTFIVFIKEYLNTKIKNPKELETLSKYPILAVIPESKLLT